MAAGTIKVGFPIIYLTSLDQNSFKFLKPWLLLVAITNFTKQTLKITLLDHT